MDFAQAKENLSANKALPNQSSRDGWNLQKFQSFLNQIGEFMKLDLNWQGQQSINPQLPENVWKIAKLSSSSLPVQSNLN